MSDQHACSACTGPFAHTTPDTYSGGVYQPFGGSPAGPDIIAWTSDGSAQYGHVEIMTAQQARHYRSQTLRHRVRLFLARLADSVRGRK